MKSIEVLSKTLKFFGWLIIAIGFFNLIQVILQHTVSLLSSLSNIGMILWGVVFLCLSYGLSKIERWAYYVGLIVFCLGIILVTISALIFLFSHLSELASATNIFYIVVYIFVISIYINLLLLLLKGKKLFIEQPPEKISNWFRKPFFIIATVGIFIWIVNNGVSVFQYRLAPEWFREIPGKLEKPDLMIENVVWEPINPKVGDTLTIYVKIKNIGNKVSPETLVSAEDQKGWHKDGRIHSLSPNEERTAVLKMIVKDTHITYNPHNFVIEIDYANLMDELNKENNKKIETIYIYPPEIKE